MLLKSAFGAMVAFLWLVVSSEFKVERVVTMWRIVPGEVLSYVGSEEKS